MFEWIYDKNKSGQAGSDCVWIDDITFPRTCYITNVEEVVATKANAIYPNPSNGSFTIALAEESSVSIYNAVGQLVKCLDSVSGIQQVDLNDAPKGLYYIRIQNGNNVDTQKLIID